VIKYCSFRSETGINSSLLELAERSENHQGDKVAIRMDGSVMDPKTGKIYSGPIEEMEDYAENQ